MKKPIKRLLVLTQVLGLSALVATACTDNKKTVTQKTDVKNSTTENAEPAKPGTTTAGSEHQTEPAKPGTTTAGSEHQTEPAKPGTTTAGSEHQTEPAKSK